MPRLPKIVPESKCAEDGGIYAALVFACKTCFETEWSFIAYNWKGHVYQIKRCAHWACFDRSGKGKWMTQEAASKLQDRY